MKYFLCAIPMFACIEVLSYACLCAMVLCLAFDLFVAVKQAKYE